MLRPKAWEPSTLLLYIIHSQTFTRGLWQFFPSINSLQRVKFGSVARPPTPGSRQPAVAHAHAIHPKQPWRIARKLTSDTIFCASPNISTLATGLSAASTRSIQRLRVCWISGGAWRSVEKSAGREPKVVGRAGSTGGAANGYRDDLGILSGTGACDAATQPSWRVARSPNDFLYMVERVDICIQFLKSHRNSKEAEVYLLRFQQCMTRAMTLIKMYFVGSLRALTQDVSRRLFEQDVSDTAQMHLLYTRFTTVAGQLAPLLGEFERRAHSHPEELGALLSECHAAYFVARKNLLVSRLTEQIRGLDPTRTELVELTRAAPGSRISRLLANTQYLETLCDYLYDDLRPRILHEPRLTVLCETLDDEIEENEEKNDNLGRLHIRHLLQMVLQDAQTRLFFKAQAVIPTYDTILQRPKIWRTPISLLGAQTGYEIREKQSISHLFEVPGLNQHETWYPTLSKTVWVLSQLHDFPTIFYDLAHKASGFDGQLFLFRHLLILKEITRNLDLVQKDEPQGGGGSGGTDQYGVADMLSSVLSRTSTLPLGSLFTSLDSMRAEHLANARRGIDQDLKHACESVISVASEPLRTPLRTFTGRPTSAAEAAVLDEAFRNACASDLRASIARVFLYVPDVRTAGVLVQHALDRVEDAYSAFSLAARQVGARAGKGQDCLMDDGLLKQLLQDVREDGSGSPPART
ncbi:hypothetical protein BGW80DRAFT_1567900 [Lactifluus volemus]|nr:hypothetical protein BGW80DRAFT_1567900 [Lactifluus volemus]